MPVARRRLPSGLLDQDGLAERVERADHFVYAIWDGEYLKVGKSSVSPYQRMKDLQTANARTLRLVAWTVGTTEWDAHCRFLRHRARGEWHHAHPDLLCEIAAKWSWVDVALLTELRYLAALAAARGREEALG